MQRPSRPSPQLVGVGVLGLAAVAAGAALGMGAERVLVGHAFRHDPDRDEPYSDLHAPAHRLDLPDGVGLHVEVETPPDFRPGVDPTLIFCHGFCLNADTWYYQRRDLAGIGRIVVYDHRSHGRSDRAPNGTHTIEQLGADLAAVIEDTAPEGPVILIGHSMGGMTVMALAQQQPQLFGTRVVGVAMIATSAGGVDAAVLGLPPQAGPIMRRFVTDAAAIMSSREPLVDPIRHRATDLAYLLTKTYSFGGWSSRSMTKFVNDMISGTPLDVIVEYLPTIMEHERLDSLLALERVPTLVLVGDHDLMTPASHSELILTNVPHADFVVLPASGHMVLLERHSTVNLKLRRLIQRAMAQ